MGNVTSEYMCTNDYCPCPYDLDLDLWSNDTRNQYWGRTINPLLTYNYEMIYKNYYSSDVSFNSFYDCYMDRKNNIYANSSFVDSIDEKYIDLL